MERHDRKHDPMGSETEKEWKDFKAWGWAAGAALLGILTGALVRVWVGGTDAKLGEHDARLASHEATFYRNEGRLSIMETEHRQLQRDRADMEERIRTLCRKVGEC